MNTNEETGHDAEMGRDAADPVDRALTLMGMQQWSGSGRSPRVEEAIAGHEPRSIGMKRRKKMVVAGLMVGLFGATAIATMAVRELIHVRGVAVDEHGNRVEFSGMAEVEPGGGRMKIVGPDGEDLAVFVKRVEGEGQQTMKVDVDASALKPGGEATLQVQSQGATPK